MRLNNQIMSYNAHRSMLKEEYPIKRWSKRKILNDIITKNGKKLPVSLKQRLAKWELNKLRFVMLKYVGYHHVGISFNKVNFYCLNKNLTVDDVIKRGYMYDKQRKY